MTNRHAKIRVYPNTPNKGSSRDAAVPRELDAAWERAALRRRKRRRQRILGAMFGAVALGVAFVYLGLPRHDSPSSHSSPPQVEVPVISERDLGERLVSPDGAHDAPLPKPGAFSNALGPSEPSSDEAMITAAGPLSEPAPDEPASTIAEPSPPAGPVAEPAPTAQPQAPDQVRASLSPERSEPAASSLDSRVARSQLAAGVREREPVDRLDSPITLDGHQDRTILYFTELRGLAGQTVVHRWERNGQVVAIVPFAVAGERWRVYSKKTVTPEMTGDWRVVVADADGAELASESFVVEEW